MVFLLLSIPVHSSASSCLELQVTQLATSCLHSSSSFTSLNLARKSTADQLPLNKWMTQICLGYQDLQLAHTATRSTKETQLCSLQASVLQAVQYHCLQFRCQLSSSVLVYDLDHLCRLGLGLHQSRVLQCLWDLNHCEFFKLTCKTADSEAWRRLSQSPRSSLLYWTDRLGTGGQIPWWSKYHLHLNLPWTLHPQTDHQLQKLA